METRRLRKRVRGMPAERPPEWLPDGWTVEVRNTRHGKYRYYRSSVSGCTFQSKEEVLHHLSVVKHEDVTSVRASLSNEREKQLSEEMKQSLEWLPSGWILEIKSRRSGKNAGNTYKSPDSAKIRKSQPTGKKHHLTKEILDSNGELSETATVPDGLKQPPSSQENIEVKPEEENALESATLSSPCPLNPRGRSPKSGRIPTAKCTGKFGTSTEKANVESEENIKQEKVTEKPLDPSDQTVMDIQSDGKELAKHAEDEANQAGESKPGSAPNSMENSKQEDEVTLPVENVTGKLPLVSNETLKDLLGDEMKLTMPNQTISAEKGNLLDPQNKNLAELEKELGVVMRNPSTPDLVKPKHGSRKNKPMNATSRPQRLSRRLACVEADSVIDVDMGGERPCESQSKNTTLDLHKEPPQTQNNNEGMAANATESFKRQNAMDDGTMAMNQANMDWPDLSSTSLFGDSWLDPCLEFAFKTLTGDLPVLDDAIAVQEYFQQQLFSVVGSTSPAVLAPVSNSKTEAAPASDEVEIKLSSEQDM